MHNWGDMKLRKGDLKYRRRKKPVATDRSSEDDLKATAGPIPEIKTSPREKEGIHWTDIFGIVLVSVLIVHTFMALLLWMLVQ